MVQGYKIVPYATEHLFQILGHPDYIYEQARTYYELGPAYTGFVEDRVLVCTGIMRLWPGVGEAWMVPSSEISQYPLLVMKNLRRIMESLIEALNLERVQANVRVDFPAGRRWVEHLGFKAEGEMRRFHNGETYVRYARIKR